MAIRVPARTYLVGPKIPPNTYSYANNYDFGNKFTMVKKLKEAAGAGQLHEDMLAVGAELCKQQLTHLIGDGQGFKCGPKNLADAYKAAQDFKIANPGVAQPKFEKVEDFLSNAQHFVDGLGANRQGTYNTRIQKYDLDYYLSKWTFPSIPQLTKKDYLLKDRAARIAQAQRRGRDQIDSDDNDNIFSREDSPINFSDDESIDEGKSGENGGNLIDLVMAFKSSDIVKDKDDAKNEEAFDDRYQLVRKFRKVLVKNVGKIEYKKWKKQHRNDNAVFKWDYSNCSEVFNVFNTRIVYYLLLFRVFYALKPAPEKFKIFFSNKSDAELIDIITGLYIDVWKYIVSKGRINKPDGERIQSFGDMDVIKNELQTLFKVENNKLIEKKKVHCGRRSRDEFEPRGDGWDHMRKRKKRKITPSKTEPSTKDILLQNSFADMIQQSHSDLMNEIRCNRGMNTDDTVEEMISNPRRGMRHFSHEYQNYHLTKDEVYGFQIIADELSEKSVTGGGHRHKYFNRLLNNKNNQKPSRKQQLRDIQGKLGLHPFVYSVACYRERSQYPNSFNLGKTTGHLFCLFLSIGVNQF